MSVLTTINPTGAIFGPTLGLARNLQWDLNPETGAIEPLAAGAPGTGGGNLNGSANTANLLGHAGTAADRFGVPRAFSGNYTGIV